MITPQHVMVAPSDGGIFPYRIESVKSRAVAVISANGAMQATLATLFAGSSYQLAEHESARCLDELLSQGRMDAVLLDLKVPVRQSTDVAALLRNKQRDPAVPVVGVCGTGVSRYARLRAMEAGLWDVVEVPASADELVVKLENWISLKRSLERVRSEVMVDVDTGHYSASGLKRRLVELAALAHRSGEDLSCVLFAVDSLFKAFSIAPAQLESAGIEFAEALAERTRGSDVVARVEMLKFVVLAPYTPASGAVRLAERFTSWSVSRHVQGAMPVTFGAGVASHKGKSQKLVREPESLLLAASRALGRARASGAAQVAVAGDDYYRTKNREYRR